MQNSNSPSEELKLRVRKLEISDRGKGFIELLQQLSVCDSVSDEEFEDRFRELSSYGDDHVICVIEDELSGRIIATGSVFIEKKFLRNCGKVGHIEDVVVDSSAQGKHMGKKENFLTDHARSMGCYKLILDCSLENSVLCEVWLQAERSSDGHVFHLRSNGANSIIIWPPILFKIEDSYAMGSDINHCLFLVFFI